jgi:serine/threonine-protein kinase
LAAVHELRGETGEPLGLVHRDVSPHNVLVGVDGVAKLADFGLARSLARGDRSTTGGVLKGKAGYLAPEYIRGAPIDARVDIFALGVVLWESLTRERLFPAENEAATLQRILTTSPPTLASKGVDLGPASVDVQTIVERATARSPSARYATVREMADDLALVIATHALRADHGAVGASFGPSALAKIATRTPIDTVPASVPVMSPPGQRPLLGIAVAIVATVAGVVIMAGARSAPKPAAPTAELSSIAAPPSTATSLTAPAVTLNVPTIAVSALPLVPSSSAPVATSAHPAAPPHDPKHPRPNPY